jgi:hypothetical protein
MQTVDVDVEELASPSDVSDLKAPERGDRWVVGLEGGDPRDVDPGDDPADQAVAQEPDERLHLRQFWHPAILRAGGLAREREFLNLENLRYRRFRS